MRIATSTIYAQQSASINNLEAKYQQQGQNLSNGVSLNGPSDDPARIGLDLNIRTTISVENQQVNNIQAATAQLTSTDSALANLTDVLQSARSLAVGGASDVKSPTDLKAIGNQVDQLLTQSVELANTQYGGVYLFAGSVNASSPPITTSGSPVTGIHFSGNEQSQGAQVFNGQSFNVSPTLQQAFNYNATDGSPSAFDVLINLRNTLDGGLVVDKSAGAINHAGAAILGAASPAAQRTTLGTTPSPFALAPAPDSAGQYSISINSKDANGIAHVEAYTFAAGTVIDDNTATSITGAINAKNTGPNATGLSATFDEKTQRLVLTNAGGGAFTVTDEPPSGSTVTSNFTKLFALSGEATLPTTVSTQLGDIDNALDVTLNARSLVGSRVNALAQLNTQTTTDVADNTAVKSGIEDTDIAKTTSAFTATQVSLTASFSTTQRLEAKDLFDYL